MTKKILIVEDEGALLDAYAFLFEARGYEVYRATNGQEALPLLESKRPDYIILDILMPVMGGVAFLEAAHIPEKYPDTKVLVLSNLSDKKTIGTVMQLGATKYLLKASVAPRVLLEAIEAL